MTAAAQAAFSAGLGEASRAPAVAPVATTTPVSAVLMSSGDGASPKRRLTKIGENHSVGKVRELRRDAVVSVRQLGKDRAHQVRTHWAWAAAIPFCRSARADVAAKPVREHITLLVANAREDSAHDSPSVRPRQA
jgi:hypothetical protein